ncbi:MAG: hypothetical protein JNL60_14330 [Bacteroidia bacterium]|nr:hypothetical protein [Bacteroidia bacterium]
MKFLSTALLFVSTLCYSQLDNSMLFFNTKVDTSHENELFIKIQNLNFMKNNEYATYMADGYTLFGYQLNPQIGYTFARNLSLEAGVFIAKDFGKDQYHKVLPTFSLRYYKKDFKMVFGNLDGSVNHQLIEPLYNFEKVLTNRLESGAQFVLNTRTFDFDAWINWVNMIYKPSGEKEKLFVRLNLNVLKFRNEKWEFRIPLQFTAVHTGGQIDTLNSGSSTDMAYAGGFVLKRLFASGPLKNVYCDVRYAARENGYYFDTIAIKSYGDGLLANIGCVTKFNTDVMLSYWNATNFYTEFGGDLYSSQSRNIAYPKYYESLREIFILRVTQKIELNKGINLMLRLEPNYDMRLTRFDHSYGFYISIDETFWLKKKIKPE